MLLCGADLLGVDAARKLIEREENPPQQIAFAAGHAFLDGNANLARIV